MLGQLLTRLKGAVARNLELHGLQLHQLAQNLEHLNPQSVLERGYSLVHKVDGEIVRTSNDIRAGETLELTFAQGKAVSRVIDVE
jgi:exodeoxyribonuclease VII large subunit